MNTQVARVNPINAIEARSNQHWPALRESGKIDRMNFTDAIKAFNDYVDKEGEGASRPDLAYSNFTRSVYAAFGLNSKQREALMNGDVKSRDMFDLMELRFLQMAESTAAAIIFEGIEAQATRKAIKAAVKAECGSIAGSHRRVSKGIFKGAAQ